MKTKIRYSRMSEPGTMEVDQENDDELTEEDEETVKLMEIESRVTSDPI